MATNAVEIPASQSNRLLILAVIVVVFGVMATSLPQTQGLGVIPIRNLLKNALHVSREESARFVFWATLPWYFKPLVGIVQDAFPLFRTRRRSYMLVGSVLSTAAWFALDIAPLQYQTQLAMNIAINTAMVIASTAVGGYMVEVARASASSGRLTSVRNAVEQFSFVISGVGSGYLAGLDFSWTGITCGAITFTLVPIAIFFLRERPTEVRSGAEVFKAAGARLKDIGRARALWIAAVVAFLFYFAPGIQTAQFYAQQNDLHMNTQQQGNLVSIAGFFGVVAAFVYGTFAAKRFTLRTLLLTCIIIGASGQASYFFYYSYHEAWFIDSYWGFAFTLAEVAMMHMAVRATPPGAEALGFALMMAVRNFGLFGGDWFGAALQDHFHMSFHSLAATNGLLSLLALPVVLLLPKAMLAGKDAQKTAPEAQMDGNPDTVQGRNVTG